MLNCVLSNTSDKCTIDVQKKSRHLIIQNSIILLKKLIFMNGKVNGSGVFNGGSYILMMHLLFK